MAGGHGHAYAHDGCSCVEHWDDGRHRRLRSPAVPRILRDRSSCAEASRSSSSRSNPRFAGTDHGAGLAWLRSTTNDLARDAIAFARPDADSGLESLLRWRLRRHRLRIRSQVAIVSVGTVDFLIGDRLISGSRRQDEPPRRAARHKDLVRDASAAAWGDITLRFDYAMIVHDWDTVEQPILALVDRGLHLIR